MKRIGLIIERHWHYGRRLCEGIAEYARTQSDWTLDFPEWSELRDRAALSRFDGFIARIWNRTMFRALRRSDRPVVDVYGCIPSGEFVTADQDARRIGQLAARHFIEHRFKNFAFCGYAGQSFSTARRESFVRALKLNGFDCRVFESKVNSSERFGRKLIARGNFDFGFDKRSLSQWLKRLEKPVAVFCAHDLLAWNVLKRCQATGIAVPGEVSILGVDNDALLCGFTNPPLSSIDQNPFGIGYTAAEALDEWFRNPKRKPKNRRVAPTELVERASTQVFPITPAWLSDALVFIRRNINRNLNANEVFRHLGLSHTIVEKTFREKIGASVRETIAATRIEEAKRLLEKTSLSLAEICTLSGFSSKPYFTTAFNAATGMTPLQWRTAHARPSRDRTCRD